MHSIGRKQADQADHLTPLFTPKMVAMLKVMPMQGGEGAARVSNGCQHRGIRSQIAVARLLEPLATQATSTPGLGQ